MLLLFGNSTIPDKEINFWIDLNIYTEKVDLREINEKGESRDYIYSTSNTDFEMEMLANKYADIVIERLRKYFSVAFKNILFDTQRPLTGKQKESYIFWDAKFATRHHINFQENRIKSLIEENLIRVNGTALAIGYLSFPCMLRLSNKYEQIYLLDNSNTIIRMYEQYLRENALELIKKVTFITFTSALFDFITEKLHLYHSLDFILLGTGSGSFIKKLRTYYKICNSWLKNEGVLYISFLNSKFLYEYVDKATAEENFEFIPELGGRTAIALTSNNTEKYNLFCETCDSNGLKDMAEKYFKVKKMYSYPLASVLEGPQKSRLQNVLKELDKEYSKNGFTIKTFSNCRGYYIDGVLKKNVGEYIDVKFPNQFKAKKIKFNDKQKYEECYLKTLLLAKKELPIIDSVKKNVKLEIYVVILSTKKMLPETTNKEICIGAKKMRLLDISEINTLGLEYKNLSPFLISKGDIVLNSNYDMELKHQKNKYFYIGDGSNDGGYEIQAKELLPLLDLYGYSEMSIN